METLPTDEKSFRELLKYYAEHYHNDVELIDDKTFDDLVDIYEITFDKVYDDVGALPRDQQVSLPYYLGSLRKIRTESEIRLYARKYPGPYVIEDKIDGLTLLYTSILIDGVRVYNMYTRGDGNTGQDVSHLVDYLNVPKPDMDFAVRGEIVITKENFEKYGGEFKTARGLVTGLVNSKDSFDPDMAAILDYVAFRIMNVDATPEEQVMILNDMGFTLPWVATIVDINVPDLTSILEYRKQEAPYEMDGLVIYHNEDLEYPDDEKPRHVVAFKMDTETAETTVIEVIWKASRKKLLKPVIYYEPVEVCGVHLRRCTGHNARCIINNSIGPGARIVVTRSGDVIPKLVDVLEPAEYPDLPDPEVHGEYFWNENEVELVLVEENDEVVAARIEYFLEVLGIKHVGPSRIQSFVEAGINTIADLLNSTVNDFMQFDRIGVKLAQKIHHEIQSKIKKVPLPQVMAACGIFDGLGQRRFESIVNHYPDIMCRIQDPDLVDQIRLIKGFNQLAYEFVEKLPLFLEWLEQHPMIDIMYPDMIELLDIEQTCAGKTIVFSGFRDSNLKTMIEQRGGRVTSSISRRTTLLILQDVHDRRGKATEALRLGVELISKDQFEEMYIQ